MLCHHRVNLFIDHALDLISHRLLRFLAKKMILLIDAIKANSVTRCHTPEKILKTLLSLDTTLVPNPITNCHALGDHIFEGKLPIASVHSIADSWLNTT